MTRISSIAALAAALAATIVPSAVQPAEKPAKGAADAAKPTPAQISRGRYLLIVGNCNDCHTAGFAPSEGKVPEKDWLLGEGKLGLRGPWGTTYATNLRLSLSKMTEEQWVKYARTLKTRPPMPWFNVNQWTPTDLRAFYQYVRQLGPAGTAVPDALPPGKEPPMPYVQWPAGPPKK